ncbi:MAG TPA: dolichyl-phosphate beta-glucosyltransferase [Candidatus Udaeobacter sp.]|jgi:dolichyl-phosphate beta-glucosyltransferase|nr:dolichyl-phosphate beta-glucosyltransferase [Candidatus Udaeobacter sp.]
MASPEIYLSVIVPAYNEAERISRTLERLDQYLGGNILTYEILVVLDGPTDNTREVLEQLSGRIPNLKIIDRQVNRGKGFTVKEGMLQASGSVRLFTDADNSTDIAHFDKMKPLFDQGCDLVIASRNSKDVAQAQQAVPQAWYKRWTGHAGNLIVQLVTVRGIWDTQCGFKAFRGEAAERVFSQTMIEGWGFDIEVLALARALNYKLGIIPARWVNDDRSHVGPFDYLGVLADTFRIRTNLMTGRYRL